MKTYNDVTQPLTVQDLIDTLEKVQDKTRLVKVEICDEYVNKNGEHAGFSGKEDGHIALLFDPDDSEDQDPDADVVLTAFTGEQILHEWKVEIHLADT